MFEARITGLDEGPTVKVDLTLLAVSLSAVMLSSTAGLVATVNFDAQKYLNSINRLDDCYGNVVDDICGMMDIALRFRDDPDYNYDPSDMDRVVMRDGVNGTQEMVDLFNDLMDTTLTDIETLTSQINSTNADG